mmetsp:Transcript_18827/g.57209  ORF Transcript_18827/g.57209 Transcript_18827/m.57209 type:complete len:359 (-) Transcript_18827:116-1192(-)
MRKIITPKGARGVQVTNVSSGTRWSRPWPASFCFSLSMYVRTMAFLFLFFSQIQTSTRKGFKPSSDVNIPLDRRVVRRLEVLGHEGHLALAVPPGLELLELDGAGAVRVEHEHGRLELLVAHGGAEPFAERGELRRLQLPVAAYVVLGELAAQPALVDDAVAEALHLAGGGAARGEHGDAHEDDEGAAGEVVKARPLRDHERAEEDVERAAAAQVVQERGLGLSGWGWATDSGRVGSGGVGLARGWDLNRLLEVLEALPAQGTLDGERDDAGDKDVDLDERPQRREGEQREKGHDAIDDHEERGAGGERFHRGRAGGEALLEVGEARRGLRRRALHLGQETRGLAHLLCAHGCSMCEA